VHRRVERGARDVQGHEPLTANAAEDVGGNVFAPGEPPGRSFVMISQAEAALKSTAFVSLASGGAPFSPADDHHRTTTKRHACRAADALELYRPVLRRKLEKRVRRALHRSAQTKPLFPGVLHARHTPSQRSPGIQGHRTSSRCCARPPPKNLASYWRNAFADYRRIMAADSRRAPIRVSSIRRYRVMMRTFQTLLAIPAVP
jgi:hypothetical protein